MIKYGIYISIIGSFGLGLLLGSEFSGRLITIFGAILMILFLLILFYSKNLIVSK